MSKLESLIDKMEKLEYTFDDRVNMFNHEILPLLNMKQAEYLIYKVVTFNEVGGY